MDTTAPFLLADILGTDVCKLISSYLAFPCSPEIRSLSHHPIKAKMKRWRGEDRETVQLLFELQGGRLIRKQKKKVLKPRVRGTWNEHGKEWERWRNAMLGIRFERQNERLNVRIKKHVMARGEKWVDRPHHWWELSDSSWGRKMDWRGAVFRHNCTPEEWKAAR